jgi:hypothetical protein
MHQQAAGAVDPDGQDSCRPLSAGTRVGSVPRASKQSPRMAVSEGWIRRTCSQCSQSCSHSCPMDSLSSQCSAFPGMTSMDALFSAVSSATRNTGNIGNRIETAGVGPATHVEQTGNKTGNIEANHPVTNFGPYWTVFDPGFETICKGGEGNDAAIRRHIEAAV